MKQVTTLSLIEDGDKILLAMKKRGFGVGLWNGYGGKVHEGETVEEAMVRELQEESGILAKGFRERAILHFDYKQKGLEVEMHIFEVTDYEGAPKETDEMTPKWFLKKDVPFDVMWPDDREWLPLFLEGKDFEGHAVFEGANNAMVESDFHIKKVVDGRDFGAALGTEKLG